jgi:hypothetical protein
MSRRVTVIGGGIAGLVAAITCAEGGADVVLVEARDELGGRARSSGDRFVTNFGPHALYRTRPHWVWLRERGLMPPTATLPASSVRFVRGGRSGRLPPAGLLRAVALGGHGAPHDAAFRPWAAERAGAGTADMLCRIAGVLTFDHDPGRLSAAFVWERLLWVYSRPAVVRFVLGGWGRLVDRLADRARQLGVAIEIGRPVDVLPDPPVIVATELVGARALLDDDTLRWTGARTVLLDVGVRSADGDPGAVVDLDDGAFLERYSAVDRSIVPAGHELIQAQAGLRPEEAPEDAAARIERALDARFAGWRGREVWRRRQLVQDRSGALDLPGTSWRQRPRIDRGAGVFLAGDMVAAPGFLSEVSFASGVAAGRRAATWAAA